MESGQTYSPLCYNDNKLSQLHYHIIVMKETSAKAVRLVHLMNLLTTQTNKNRVISKEYIYDYYKKHELGQPDRKTFYSDLADLQTHFDLEIEYSRKEHGYRVLNPKFEPYELRLIIDSVQASKMITSKEADSISKKIKEFADDETAKHLDRKAYVNDRIRNINRSILDSTDVIYSAIAADSQIEFRYAHYNPTDKENKKFVKNGEPMHVSPFALYWNDGNYYLYAYNSELRKPDFRTYRIDRMDNVIQSISLRREGKDLFNPSNLTNKRNAKVFDMYKSGKEYTVQLRCLNRLADQIIDTFGKDTFLMKIDDNHFLANVFVDCAPTFYAWVSTFGKRMKIVNPPPVVEGMKDFIGKVASMYED